MENWQNKSLDNLFEVHEGILYVEEWKPIKGFEALYEISSFGRVKSTGTFKAHPISIKNQRILSNGYCHVSLWKDNKEKNSMVHRLVAIAFILNPEHKKTVNHKKGIKIDNRFHQLEWATQGENASHSFKELGRKSYMKGLKGKDCRFSKPINQYDLNGNFIARHDSITEAANKVNTSRRNICHNVKGNQKTAGGYKWEYA